MQTHESADYHLILAGSSSNDGNNTITMWKKNVRVTSGSGGLTWATVRTGLQVITQLLVIATVGAIFYRIMVRNISKEISDLTAIKRPHTYAMNKAISGGTHGNHSWTRISFAGSLHKNLLPNLRIPYTRLGQRRSPWLARRIRARSF